MPTIAKWKYGNVTITLKGSKDLKVFAVKTKDRTVIPPQYSSMPCTDLIKAKEYFESEIAIFRQKITVGDMIKYLKEI